jgi:hypothetical protein
VDELRHTNGRSALGRRSEPPFWAPPPPSGTELRIEDRNLAIDHEFASGQGGHHARNVGEALRVITAR